MVCTLIAQMNTDKKQKISVISVLFLVRGVTACYLRFHLFGG